jgi:hypothetical protein
MGKRYDAWKARVDALSAKVQADGCSDSPDLFYTDCCDEHDIAYRTGFDEDGSEITRAQADKQLFECMKKAGKTPVVGRWLVPAIYYGAVRLFGSGSWKGKG